MTEEEPLPRSLSAPETWSFGTAVFLFWAYSAQSALVALGPASLAVWSAVAGVSALINFQVRRLAQNWPDLVGGSPSYASRLWAGRPVVGRYAAMAYFISWATVPAIAANFLDEAIGPHFPAVATGPAKVALMVGLTVVPFVVAWSGIRAVALLQVLYTVPILGILVAFVVSGVIWLVFAPDSPGLVFRSVAAPEPVELVKWFFLLTFSVYGAETAAVFLGESRAPRATTRSFVALAAAAVPLYVGASLVLLQVGPVPTLEAHNGFIVTAERMWGEVAPFVGSLLLAGVALLSSSAAVAVAPRVLYQQARDGQLPRVFGIASDRGVPGPSLLAMLVISVFFVLAIDPVSALVASTACWFAFWILLHAGIWHARGRREALWPRIALLLAVAEVSIFVIGGVALGAGPVMIGLLSPVALLGVAAAVGTLDTPTGPRWLRTEWWRDHYRPKPLGTSDGGVGRQVTTVVILVSGTVAVAWGLSIVGAAADLTEPDASDVLFAVTLLIIGFFAVAVAGSTTLGHLAALSAARVRAEAATVALEREQTLQRAANEELERINRAQRDFVSIVSHEFRTPLTGIQGFAEIIRDEDISVAETKEFADDIHRDAVRLARMIGEILDLERMRSGRMTLVRVPVDLPALIRDVADRVGARTPDHPIELRLGPTPIIQGDADKLTQVLTNLLSNAIKYSPHGGPITISCGVDHNGVALAVIDRGIGIPEDQLDSVFDPYTRVEASATKDVQGTGLGLPIVREIVRLHGGRVWAEPAPGGGSAFRVRLPLPAGLAVDGGPGPAIPVPAP